MTKQENYNEVELQQEIEKAENFFMSVSEVNQAEVLDIEQAAERLQISPATVRNWIRHDYLTPIDYPGQKVRFSLDQVEKLRQDLLTGQVTRLRKRANKDSSAKSFLPDEYLTNTEARQSVESAVNLIVSHNIGLEEALYFLTLNYLFKHGLVSFRSALETPYGYESMNFLHKQAEKEMKIWAGNIRFSASPAIQEKLFTLDIPDTDDFLGTVYQSVHLEGKKAQTGAYYTPRAIVEDITGKYVTHKDMKILDPCCGTGQFLLVALDKLKEMAGPASIINVWGMDTDEIAVRIARINVIVKCKDVDNFSPCIYSANSLLDGCGDMFVAPEERLKKESFDLVMTNPPWGAKLTKGEELQLKEYYPNIKSGESFSFFLAKGLDILKKDGILSFILPEAFLNVRMHADVRSYILKRANVKRVIYLNRVFKNVFTPVIRLDLQKGQPLSNSLVEVTNGDRFIVKQSDFEAGEDCIFNIHVNNQTSNILEKIYAQTHVTLKGNAEWALGIVTGDNGRYIRDKQEDSYEGILKGKDILKYRYKQPSNFIKFEPEKFQQVAPTERYRAHEKLIYRFISKELVFAYDNQNTLTLNSANILIPRLSDLSMKFILALFNSSLFQFIFQKKMNSIKVLRSHLEALPIPKWPSEKRDNVVRFVDSLLTSESDVVHMKLYRELDEYIMMNYALDQKSADYIHGQIRISKKLLARQ